MNNNINILYQFINKLIRKIEINQKNSIIIFEVLIFFLFFSIIKITFPLNYEFINMDNYLKLCNNTDGSLFKYSKKKILRVSIIAAVYNRGKYLLRFLKSIQNQHFENIEIILIDDFSSDNTINLIKLYQSIDQRIILIKNKKNFGTFKSRNLGILKSRGEYILIPDPDDIFSKNSLKNLYFNAIKYNYEIIRFNLYMGKNYLYLGNSVKKIKSRIIFQPELKTHSFYATGRLRYIDYNVANKFIKRKVLISALNLLLKKYLSIYMITFEDQLLNFLTQTTAKSFYFLKKICYYYIKNEASITIKGIFEKKIENVFCMLKIIIPLLKNTLYEKNIFNIIFKDFVISNKIANKTNLMKNNKKFYIQTIDLFLKDDFISNKTRKYMKKLKKILKSY